MSNGRTRRTVAIVNDEAGLLEMLRYNLEHDGYVVRAYANTADALTLIEEPADLAVSASEVSGRCACIATSGAISNAASDRAI